MFKKIKNIHFVGIGGSGMSGIAEVLLKLGYRVSGSDLVKNAEAQRLQEMGAIVWEGHAAGHVNGVDVVVTSTAVSQKNPEVREALRQNIPVIPRIEMLAELARLKYTIAIAGTHGKTTTTSLVAQILKHNGLDPTVIVGGRLKAVGTGGVLGSGDFLVAEADESDGSFLKLSPAIAVVTNIDNDHMDHYKSMAKLEDAFAMFADRIPFYGVTYLCREDPGVRRILPRLKRRSATYGFSEGCDLRAVDVRLDDGGSHFIVEKSGKKLGDVRFSSPGRHNVLNALAAISVGLELNLPFAGIAEALAQFSGVGRRIEMKGEAAGVTVIDDYGHHPTEIRATLAAVKSRYPKSRLTVMFQPHRYSRTKILAGEFAAALRAADRLFLLPIYPAGEKPIRGVSSDLIAKRMRRPAPKCVQKENAVAALLTAVVRGDVVLTLGAGDVWKLGEQLLRELSSPVHQLPSVIPSLAPHVRFDEPLARHCTWSIGGAAEAYVEVQSMDQLTALIQFCRDRAVSFFVLGWGSNVLLPDDGLRGCVVRLRGDFESIVFDGTRVRVGGGVHLPKLANACAERGLSGTEALAGVPGTVGGALMTNAGTPRGTIGDVVASVDVLNPEGKLRTLSRNEIRLGYRESDLGRRLVVSAVLNLTASDKKKVAEKIRLELSHREKTQPLGTKNVGSVFRNPPNDFAARLIEAVGLKGEAHGRVRFSPKHANFMENIGGASAKEALTLIELAQKKVKEQFGIDLVPEVKVISQDGAFFIEPLALSR